MKYVIDSSVAFKWVVPEVDSDKADRLREGHRNAVHELLAPDVFPLELAHALTRAERQKRIPIGQASVYLASALIDPPVFHASFLLLQRATNISSDLRIGIYDCVYVALAEREVCEFVTADDRLVRNVRTRFPFVIPLSSLP